MMREDESALLQNPRRRPQQEQHRQQAARIVRTRLSFCIFIYTVGASVMTQVNPKVVLEHFHGDDSEASKFHGWITPAVSVLQLIFVPALSGVSDAIGRRAVIAGAFTLHMAAIVLMAGSPNSLGSVIVCHVVSGLCIVIIPVSQAIMIDVARDESNAPGDASHGLGLAFAAIGLATAVGDIVGGSLSEHHRRMACLISASFILFAVLSLRLYGWEETAPAQRRKTSTAPTRTIREDSGSSVNAGEGAVVEGKWRRSKLSNPFTILKVFVEGRVLLQVALCYFLFVVSLNVFATGYNYLDFRFHWTPLDISLFFAAFNVFMALASGWGIRRLIPRRLSEEHGALFGISVQACAGAVYGLCFRGWMLYPALACGALQNVTEPCLQAVMARFVAEDRQGSLQGAVMSLRVMAEGIAAFMFVQVFSAGSKVEFAEAPFFLAAAISLVGLAFAWWPLRKLSKARTTPDITAESDASDDEGITSTEAGGALEHSSPDVDDTLSVSGTRREEVDRSADVPTNGASNNTSKLFVEVDEGARQEEVVIVMEVQNSDDENEDGLTKPLLDASAPRS